MENEKIFQLSIFNFQFYLLNAQFRSKYGRFKTNNA